MNTDITYAELRRQIAELETKANEARQREVIAVIADIKSKIEEYGLTVKDLGLVMPGVSPRSRTNTPVAIKYRSPDGLEWSGRGRKPAWISNALDNGSDLSEFLIHK